MATYNQNYYRKNKAALKKKLAERMKDPKRRAARNARNAASMARARLAGPRPGLHCALANAKKRHPTSDLTIEQLMKMWEDQKGCCAVSRIPMTWATGKQGGKVLATSVSIDRLNHKKHYTKKNVRLVCHAVNSFRGQMTDAQMYDFAVQIVKWNS